MMSAKRARTGSREADLALGTTLHRASGKPAGELVFGGVHLPYTPLSGDPRQPTARRTSPAPRDQPP
jgi:hypothetical protein